MFFALNKMNRLNNIALSNLHLFTVSHVSEIFVCLTFCPDCSSTCVSTMLSGQCVTNK